LPDKPAGSVGKNLKTRKKTMQAQSVSIRSRARISRETRDEIVVEHLPLVKAIAIRVHESLPVHVDLDDLVHAGVLGLFDAVAKFDETKNVAFQAYAKHRIKGAILDSLRQADWASRDMRKRQKQVESVTRDLTGRLGRTPTESEVAREMGVETERLRRMMIELRNLGLESAVVVHNEQEHDRAEEFAAAPELRPDRMCERSELRNTLARAMGTLPERYRMVVGLYYTNDMTMKEIGDVLGVNESRISQIHKTALRRMQVALESEGIHSPAAI
jgi:RNA polymerase sigma factor for flagellar operon FliA